MFIGRTDAKAETPILWPPHVKSWLIGKDPDAGRGWGAGGEGDDKGCDGWMVSPTQWTWVWVNSGSWWWTRRPGMLNSWGRKELDTTEQLNWTEWINITFLILVVVLRKMSLFVDIIHTKAFRETRWLSIMLATYSQMIRGWGEVICSVLSTFSKLEIVCK